MKEENKNNELNCNLPDYLRLVPFNVPENFFEEQAKQIGKQINLVKVSAKNMPNVPEEYFESLETEILTRIAEENLKAWDTLPGFSVPDNYFEELETEILSSISFESLKNQDPEQVFDIPQAYFNTLTENVLSTVHFDKIYNKNQDFQVPKDYFDVLSSQIQDKIKLHDSLAEDAKVVKMPSKLKWGKYAAAAAILAISTFSGYWLINSKEQNPKNQAVFQEISNEEILKYLAQVGDEDILMELTTYHEDENNATHTDFNVDKELKEKEIEEYLNYML